MKTTMQLLIITLALVPLRGTPAETDTKQLYDITKFMNHPGIYFEQLGTVQLYKDTWKLVVHVDLRAIHYRLYKLGCTIKDMKILCTTNVTEELQHFCREIVKMEEKDINHIKTNLEIITQIIDVSYPTRERRGIINGIGYLGKVLFGIMDEDDRESISKQLKSLQEGNDVQQASLLEQIQIIDANVKLYNESFQSIDENEHKLARAIENMRRTIELDRISQESQALIQENILLINIVTEKLAREANNLLNFVLNSKKGVLNPTTITPKQIIECLSEALDAVPEGLNFPFSLTNVEAQKMYEVMDLVVYGNAFSVTAIIEFPLVKAKKYKISKTYPVPAKINGSLYAFLETAEPFVVMDINSGEYIHFDAKDVERCKVLNKKSYLCNVRHPIFRVISNGPCEIQLYTKLIRQPTNCNTRIMNLDHTILIELMQPGTWIYVTPTSIELVIDCETEMAQQMQIQGSGIISIKRKCTVTSSEFILETSKKYESEKTYNYLPEFNLSSIHLPSQRNITRLKYDEHFTLQKVIKHPEQLYAISKRLSELRTNIVKTKTYIPIEIHYGVILVYGTSLVVVILIAVLLTRRYCL